MISALENAWTAIRSNHREVPAVVIVLGAGSVRAPAGSLKLGHFAALRWSSATDSGNSGGTSGKSSPDEP